ncbi:MAG: carboxynorspermidine decarboxylase [Thermodesulfobacteriota bacterium]
MIPDIAGLRTPCYIIHLGLLRNNLRILSRVQNEAGCEILLALKGFAAWSTFPLIRETLRGVTASSLHEAMLGREEFGGEVHLCAPAYRDDEMDEILACVDHIVFNSFTQWQRHRHRVRSNPRDISCGLRVNPEHSEVATAIYDPCAPKSRLGILPRAFEGQDLDGIEGLHFHNLCELNADSLERTLAAFEAKFGRYIRRMKWINFGGGHHITRKDYDVERLCRLVRDFRTAYGVRVYLEPGEAVALNTGYLAAEVLDILHNRMDIAILDTSAAAHMPDVLEMPYRPVIEGAGLPGEHPHEYRLGGLTCLAGDVIGDYSFPEPLQVGQRLIFHDMAHYSMVKNNTFNGVRLPDIVLYEPDTETFRVVREFSYPDYKNRLS